MISELNSCVACGASQYEPVEEWRGFHIVRCRECGLEFTRNPNYRADMYRHAYLGQGELLVPYQHSYVYLAPFQRMQLEAAASILPPPRLTPSERAALQWLERNAPPGAVIVDCGCGSGRFLRALRRAGFEPVGIELSEELVSVIKQLGIRAILGKAPDFEWNDIPPFAITFFEVLEHLPEPLETLKALRARFPSSAILASVPSPLRPGRLLNWGLGLSDYPPNHFLRWTPEALRRAFGRAGYSDVQVIVPSPVGSEVVPGFSQIVFALRMSRSHKSAHSHETLMKTNQPESPVAPISRVRATSVLWLAFAYQRIADVLGWPRAFLVRRKGASSKSMLVISRP